MRSVCVCERHLSAPHLKASVCAWVLESALGMIEGMLGGTFSRASAMTPRRLASVVPLNMSTAS